MVRTKAMLLIIVVMQAAGAVQLLSQFPAHHQYTLLDDNKIDMLIGEASGERAFKHIVEMAGYPMLRPIEDFEGDLMETRYVMRRLKEYGFDNAVIDRFGTTRSWQGVSASLWEVSPGMRKIADLPESPLMLASGSADIDAEGELVWIDLYSSGSGYEDVDLEGKIVLTGERPGRILPLVLERGALAVITYFSPRPLQNSLMIPATSTGVRGELASRATAFFVSPREGEALARRVASGERVVIRAHAEATVVDAELQVISCLIEGTDPQAEEVIITAHLFEGYVKTGGNDNISGSAAILETARVLKKLIDNGELERPARTIRFLWVPEFTGTIPWVAENSELMRRTLCNINLDMVGLALAEHRSFFVLHRTSYGNAHYVGDVLESFYRYTGETNKVNSVPAGSRFFRYITAPTGTDDPFYYQIESASGGSDHVVFNDLGVMVPGVLLITWPDPFYHTSEDIADKCDPTQLKRTVFITAAGAYTIASADISGAMAVAAETASNSLRRMGIAHSSASEMIAKANGDNLDAVTARAISNIRGSAKGEALIIESINELAPDSPELKRLLDSYVNYIKRVGDDQVTALADLSGAVAALHDLPAPAVRPSREERRAARITPGFLAPTVNEGYRAMQSLRSSLPAELREMVGGAGVADLHEALKLADGNNSLLDIKQMLDAQNRRETSLSALTMTFEALRQGGVVNW